MVNMGQNPRMRSLCYQVAMNEIFVAIATQVILVLRRDLTR